MLRTDHETEIVGLPVHGTAPEARVVRPFRIFLSGSVQRRRSLHGEARKLRGLIEHGVVDTAALAVEQQPRVAVGHAERREGTDAGSEMILRQLRIDANSPFLGKTLKDAGIREKYHCLIVGVERGGETLHAPDVHEPFVEEDVVWIVGENVDVYKLVGENDENVDL